MHGHPHTILHLPAKFCSNLMIVGGVMTSYPFISRWRSAAILDLMCFEIAYSHLFLGVLGALFPQIWSPTVLTPKKALPYAETRRLSHKA